MTKRFFHEIIGIELDGVVQSAPITLSTQSTWTSFGGQVEISGNFTQQPREPGRRPAVRLPTGRAQAADLSDGLAHPGRSALEAGLGAGIAGLASWCCSTCWRTTAPSDWW